MSESKGKAVLRLLSNKYRGMNLYMGNCSSCKPCSFMTKHKCKGNRTYSLESVGVDCESLHRKLYASILPWYFRETFLLPSHITRYCGILTGDAVDPEEAMTHFIINATKEELSWSSAFQALEYPSYGLELIDFRLPAYHSGSVQKVYRFVKQASSQ